ncbi:MAG TPA: hypothetical protein VK698_36845 [Kofleriaceae bacterium]|nr:hypothetical protein [Kofleriaceae bacterium]
MVEVKRLAARFFFRTGLPSTSATSTIVRQRTGADAGEADREHGQDRRRHEAVRGQRLYQAGGEIGGGQELEDRQPARRRGVASRGWRAALLGCAHEL